MCPGDPGTSFGEHHGPHASGYAASPALWGASGSHGPRLGKTQLKATLPASWAFWSAQASFCPAHLQGCACPPAPASHLAPAHPTLGLQPAGGQQVLCPASGVVYPVLPGSRQRLLWRDSKPSPGLHLRRPALSSRPSALIECPLLSNDLPSGRASKPSGRAGFREDGAAPTLRDQQPAAHPGPGAAELGPQNPAFLHRRPDGPHLLGPGGVGRACVPTGLRRRNPRQRGACAPRSQSSPRPSSLLCCLAPWGP